MHFQTQLVDRLEAVHPAAQNGVLQDGFSSVHFKVRVRVTFLLSGNLTPTPFIRPKRGRPARSVVMDRTVEQDELPG